MPQCPACQGELVGDETFCPHCLARLTGQLQGESGKGAGAEPSPRARPPFQQVEIDTFDDSEPAAKRDSTPAPTGLPGPRPPLFQDLDALDTLVGKPTAGKGGWRSRWKEQATRKGMGNRISVTVPRRMWRLRWLFLLAAACSFLALGVSLGSLYWKPAPEEPAIGAFELASAYYAEGRFEVAQHIFGEAVLAEMGQPEPQLSPALTMMGWSAYRLKEHDEASAYFGAAMGMDSTAPDPQIGMGLATLALGNPEEAQLWLMDARDMAPDLPAAHRALGQLYLEQDKPDLAIDALQSAADLDPSDYESLRWLGLAYHEAGDPEKAIKALELVVPAAPDPDVLRALADSYMALGRNEEAVTVADRLLQTSPQDPELQYLYGLALLRADRLREAQAVFARIVDGPAGRLLGDAFRAVGLAHSNAERYEEALTALDQSLAIQPGDALALELKGWALARMGRCSDALPVFEQALEIDATLQGAAEGRAACRDWLGL